MKFLLLFITTAFFSVSCATKAEKKEIRTKAEESHVKSHSQLGKTIHTAIKNSSHLTSEQRKQIEEIIALNKKTAEELSERSYQFRSVLIQELLAENFDDKKVRIIKKNIRNIEKDRLKNTLEAVEKISRVVARSQDKAAFAEALTNFERIR